MKQFLFCLSLIFLLTFSSMNIYAQSNIGLRAGLNYTNIIENLPDNGGNVFTTDELKFTTGWHIGASFEIPLHDRFLVQPELLYNLKGANRVSQSGISSKLTLSYITAPILFGFQPNESIRLLFGPEIDYLIGASQNTSGIGSQDVTNFYEDFAVGLTGGASYFFYNGINIGLRGHYGASSIIGKVPFNSEDGTYLGDLTASNLYFSVSFGYSL